MTYFTLVTFVTSVPKVFLFIEATMNCMVSEVRLYCKSILAFQQGVQFICMLMHFLPFVLHSDRNVIAGSDIRLYLLFFACFGSKSGGKIIGGMTI